MVQRRGQRGGLKARARVQVGRQQLSVNGDGANKARRQQSGDGDGNGNDANKARIPPTVPTQVDAGAVNRGVEGEAGGRQRGSEESPRGAAGTATMVEAGARTGQEENPEKPRGGSSPTAGGLAESTQLDGIKTTPQ